MVKRIRVLALDIDGVLTDGTTSLGNLGEEDKRISFQDLDAVAQAQRLGLRVALVTGEDNASVERMAQRFGVGRAVHSAKDKAAALTALATEWGIPLNVFCYVGDGDRDAPALSRVGLGLAPVNSTVAAKQAAHRVLSRPGGAGAVAEAVALVSRLNSADKWVVELEAQARQIVESSLAAHQRLLDESVSLLVRVVDLLAQTIRTGHKILLFGNGGSAADAQHVAGELVGRFLRERRPWPALALTTDTSVLTAVGNDWKFSDVFARQVRALAKPGDVVVGISTSGRSANVLLGLKVARQLGATTVGFTGIGGGQMRSCCDVCFCAPAESAPRIQELHILAWHCICELLEQALGDDEVECGWP